MHTYKNYSFPLNLKKMDLSYFVKQQNNIYHWIVACFLTALPKVTNSWMLHASKNITPQKK